MFSVSQVNSSSLTNRQALNQLSDALDKADNYLGRDVNNLTEVKEVRDILAGPVRDRAAAFLRSTAFNPKNTTDADLKEAVIKADAAVQALNANFGIGGNKLAQFAQGTVLAGLAGYIVYNANTLVEGATALNSNIGINNVTAAINGTNLIRQIGNAINVTTSILPSVNTTTIVNQVSGLAGNATTAIVAGMGTLAAGAPSTSTLAIGAGVAVVAGAAVLGYNQMTAKVKQD